MGVLIYIAGMSFLFWLVSTSVGKKAFDYDPTSKVDTLFTGLSIMTAAPLLILTVPYKLIKGLIIGVKQ